MGTSTSILVLTPIILAGIASLLATEEGTSQAGVQAWDALAFLHATHVAHSSCPRRRSGREDIFHSASEPIV
jgi:hypothetical protein